MLCHGSRLRTAPDTLTHLESVRRRAMEQREMQNTVELAYQPKCWDQVMDNQCCVAMAMQIWQQITG
jgi:hypothetical protein